MKNCPQCNHEKPLSEFPKRAGGKVGSWCRACKKIKNAEYRKTLPAGYDRNANLKAKFGITLQTFDAISKEQGGVCAICGEANKGKHLVVDHCHTTGKIRELLCSRCNTGLGMFKENPVALRNAISYLRKHKEAQ